MFHIAFEIGRTQQMAGTLQADATLEAGALDQGVPMLERQWHDKVADKIKVSRHLGRVTADTQLIGVFQHQRQQPGGRLATKDGAAVAGSQ